MATFGLQLLASFLPLIPPPPPPEIYNDQTVIALNFLSTQILIKTSKQGNIHMRCHLLVTLPQKVESRSEKFYNFKF